MVVNFAYVPLSFLQVAWVRQILHLGAFAYGLFGAASVLGIITGSIFSGRLMKRFTLPQITAGAVALIGGAMAVFSRLPFFVPDLGLLFLLGIGVGAGNPAILSAVQRDTPPQMLGRVMGAVLAFVQLASPLGAAVGGLMTAVVPLGVILLGAGILCILSIGLLIRVRVPDAKNTDRATSGQPG